MWGEVCEGYSEEQIGEEGVHSIHHLRHIADIMGSLYPTLALQRERSRKSGTNGCYGTDST